MALRGSVWLLNASDGSVAGRLTMGRRAIGVTSAVLGPGAQRDLVAISDEGKLYVIEPSR